VYRLRGDILLKRNPADLAAAEDAYKTGIAIAKKQGARSWGLRTALSLAKLYQSLADTPSDRTHNQALLGRAAMWPQLDLIEAGS
jgi:hypothetical protein